INRRAGEKLRQLRESLGLTLREVEGRSEKIAREKGNSEYAISRGWLADIENGQHLPSMYKFYSLGVIYGCGWSRLTGFFDLTIADVAKDQALFGLPRTHLLDMPAEYQGETIALPLQSREAAGLEKTNLLSGLTSIWGDIPVELVQRLSPQKALYGYIGLTDYTLYPLIPPGTFVQIDVNQKKITPGPTRFDFDRAIYFIELRNGYAYGWCELEGEQLIVVPHPHSGSRIRRFEHPREAEIVGRVTGVAMRIAKRLSDPG
ncbi:MAG: helix-turn-helix transcriptional regulator, partial [Candidatus Acidiferrales bacterium]